MLNILLKKLIKTASGRTRFVMAVIGLSIALLLILCAVQIQINYNTLLYGKNNADSTTNFLVINKQVNYKTLNATSLSNNELNQLKQQKFVDAVGTISPSAFKASIESYTKNFPFYTDIAFESVPDEFLDINVNDWKWTEESEIVPMIIPNMFLDIYNFQFSVSQGYPQITQDALKMILFKINLYNSNGTVQSYTGKIAGFSDRISSVLVPQNFMNWANKLFSNNATIQPSRVVIKTKDPGNPNLVNYLKQNGLTTDADKTRFSKYRQIVNAVVNVSWITGAVMMLFALLIFTLFIQLTIASCQQEIELLITLGASPKQLKMFLIKQFYPSNIFIAVACIGIITVVQYWLYNFLQKQNIFLSPFISIYTIATAIIILLVLWLVNIGAIKKYIG